MAAKLKLSAEKINEMMGSPAVRKAVAAKAARVLPRAKSLAYSSGADGTGKALEVIEGVRPGTKSPSGLRRPYARIRVEVTDEVREQDRGSKLSRRQILRRSSSA
ncbi:hypothetical protein JTF08_13720 [Micrococcaceae bacterium RIT802]|nr:hypothetical protein [Micrococcaceae bacterium RIT 802]